MRIPQMNYLSAFPSELRRIPLLGTRVNRGLERVVGRPLAPGARFVYSRWRVKNPRWVSERKDKSKVTQYTNQQLEDILTERARHGPHRIAQASGRGSQGTGTHT